ncbi:alpha/beta-hydrolase [Calocera cornea HHB12733]|uniref:Alpha/beta-hydrolase n=1 Tax=Calocera cornea HHB12733 TaxID=1353952 RepID=A0A165DMJ1_9BASI|nr:alpha/beta-hydrolase [Calocera cornea HHB12733]
MSVLARLKKAILYVRLKFHFTLLNLIIKLVLRKRPHGYPSHYMTITGVNSHGRLRIYLHSPPPTDPAHNKLGQRPVHINFHGGGFCLNFHGRDARFCSLVAHEASCYVVDAHYRMAPNHPWPAAYQDCRRVLEWVRANERGMFDTEKITIGGNSAGANLALAVAGTAKEGELKGVVAFYPPVDFTVLYSKKPPPPRTRVERAIGIVIPPREADRFHAAYQLDLPSQAMLADPRLSPRFAPPEKFPGDGCTMILSCEYDYLDREAREIAQVLEDAGREPVRVWVKGMGHARDQLCDDGTEGARARDEMWRRAVEVIRHAQA